MEALLLLGGNQGDRLHFLEQSCRLIEERAGVVKSYSSVYETEPWGFNAEQTFYNIALLIDTQLKAEELLKVVLNIEFELGRRRSGAEGYESRPIDIDIIFYGNLVCESATLTLPHPRMCERKFVMIPVAQIAPNYMHPIKKLSMSTLLNECKDELEVKKVCEIFGKNE